MAKLPLSTLHRNTKYPSCGLPELAFSQAKLFLCGLEHVTAMTVLWSNGKQASPSALQFICSAATKIKYQCMETTMINTWLPT